MLHSSDWVRWLFEGGVHEAGLFVISFQCQHLMKIDVYSKVAFNQVKYGISIIII